MKKRTDKNKLEKEQFSVFQNKLLEKQLLLSAKNTLLIDKIYNSSTCINDYEFSVFSQWGDDGIIQFLIDKIDIKNSIFIEFGVENYEEANTRFLLLNNNWSGLIMDSSKSNIDHIKNHEIYWKYDLTAKEAFVNAENINELIVDSNFEGDIGLLHIDIDGNDYWVWKALNIVNPDIAIVEYNSVFGIDRAITIPYNPNFSRGEAHASHLYWGASLPAFCDLAEEKGYCFVGCNSAGNNAYFVKKEKCSQLNVVSVQEGFIESKFRESRDENNLLTYVRGEDRKKLIRGTNVYNTRTNNLEIF